MKARHKILSKVINSRIGKKLTLIGAFPIMCILTLIALKEINEEKEKTPRAE